MKNETQFEKLNPEGVLPQLHREFAVAHLIVVTYFVWWLIFACDPNGSAEKKYVLGMPEWFFFGAVIGLIAFVILAAVVVKTVFRETEAEDEL